MSSLTIRNLDHEVKLRLREQAARHGHSMEQEVRQILQREVGAAGSGTDFVNRIRDRVRGLETDLPVPRRRSARMPKPPAERAVSCSTPTCCRN